MEKEAYDQLYSEASIGKQGRKQGGLLVNGLVRVGMGHSSEECEYWSNVYFPGSRNPGTEVFDVNVVDDAIGKFHIEINNVISYPRTVTHYVPFCIRK